MDLYHSPPKVIKPRKFLPPIFKDYIHKHKSEWIENMKSEVVKFHLSNENKNFSQCLVDNATTIETVKIDQETRNFLLEIILKRIFTPDALVHGEIYNLLSFAKTFMNVKKSKIQISIDWRHIYNFINCLFFSTEANNLYFVANFYG
jgi:hypothetical protein